MKIINLIPIFLKAIDQWEKKPSRRAFYTHYIDPAKEHVDLDFSFYTGDLYDWVDEIEDWQNYRKKALKLRVSNEEKLVAQIKDQIEKLFQFTLAGEVVLFGAFGLLDGYARFDRGGHRVYLGVDHPDLTLDIKKILFSHELSHVARESRDSVWTGWNLNPKMSQTDFVNKQPVIEHLVGEGFSCVVSELLYPGKKPWHYVYQSQKDLKNIVKHAPALEEVIFKELKKQNGNYRLFYNINSYNPNLPIYSHYVWAWQWTKRILKEKAQSDPAKLVSMCSRDWIDHALQFRLEKIE